MTSHYTPTPTIEQVRQHSLDKRFELLETTKSKKHFLFLIKDIESLLNLQK